MGCIVGITTAWSRRRPTRSTRTPSQSTCSGGEHSCSVYIPLRFKLGGRPVISADFSNVETASTEQVLSVGGCDGGPARDLPDAARAEICGGAKRRAMAPRRAHVRRTVRKRISFAMPFDTKNDEHLI